MLLTDSDWVVETGAGYLFRSRDPIWNGLMLACFTHESKWVVYPVGLEVTSAPFYEDGKEDQDA